MSSPVQCCCTVDEQQPRLLYCSAVLPAWLDRPGRLLLFQLEFSQSECPLSSILNTIVVLKEVHQ